MCSTFDKFDCLLVSDMVEAVAIQRRTSPFLARKRVFVTLTTCFGVEQCMKPSESNV